MTNAEVWQELARRIQTKRKKCKLSQKQLAHKLDVSTRQIKRWESGRCTIPVEQVLLLSKALDTPVWSLLYGLDEFVSLPKTEPLPFPKKRKNILTSSTEQTEKKPSLAVLFWRRQTSHFDYKEKGVLDEA